MEIGLHALGIGGGARRAVIDAVAGAAEAGGFATLWSGEHVVMVDRTSSRYPYAANGRIAVPADADWLDPLIGLLGAVLIGVWSVGLLRRTGTILLDREMDDPLVGQVRERLESDGDARVADLHLFRVDDARFACHATLVADAPLAADVYRARLAGLPALAHVSIEINRCRGAASAPGE